MDYIDFQHVVNIKLSDDELTEARAFVNKSHTGSNHIQTSEQVSPELMDAHWSINAGHIMVVPLRLYSNGKLKIINGSEDNDN